MYLPTSGVLGARSGFRARATGATFPALLRRIDLLGRLPHDPIEDNQAALDRVNDVLPIAVKD